MDGSLAYPRVLIVNGEPYGNSSGSGITLSALVQGWPADRMASLFTSKPFGMVDGVRYCKIRPYGYKFYGPGSMTAKTESFDKLSLSSAVERVNLSLNRPSLGVVRYLLRIIEDICPYPISASIWKWILDFSPDVVYSMLGNVQIMRLALGISRRLNIPIIPHFMDDWIQTMYRQSTLLTFHRKMLHLKLLEIVKRSTSGLAISKPMASEYKNRFGLPFSALMNCVSMTSESFDTNFINCSGSIRCVYVGGLHLNRWRNLSEMGRAICGLRDEGHHVQLTIYCPRVDLERYGSHISNLPFTRVAGSLMPSEVPCVLKEYDILIHVESFDAADRRYTRLSLSTKIPQYMAAGRPILGYGPEEVASIKYIKETQTGLTVGRNDSELLKDSLRRLVIDCGLRLNLGSRGREIASTIHNAERQREEFRQIIISAVEMHKRKGSTGR
jgi:hypothetical protein